MPADYTSLYQSAGNTFNVDPLLAQAVAQVESGENPNAVSRDAQGNPIAHGQMQLTQPNLQRLNVPDPYNPEYNIPAGTRMLDEALTTSNGNVPLALRIYQGGTDQSKWGPQNAAYPAKVAQKYQALKAAQPAAASVTDNGGAGSTPPSADPPIQTMVIRPSATPATAAPDDTDAFLTGKTAVVPAPATASGTKPATPNVGDDVDAFLSGGAVATPAELAGAPGKPGQIDPVTGRPFQFVGNVPANDAVGQSTGKPIAEDQIPGVGTQAAGSLGITDESKRRIVAHQLFPDKPDAEALSRVFYGPDGRMAAVGENGQPFYVDPMPSHAPGIFSPGPTSLAQSIPTNNPLARVSSGAGEVPAMVGAGLGGALSGGNPLAVGAGASVGDLVRQEVAKYFDPQSPNIDLAHAGVTGAGYGATEALGRAGAAFLPKNALAAVPPPASGPFSVAGRLADEPKYLPADIRLMPQPGSTPTSANPLAAPTLSEPTAAASTPGSNPLAPTASPAPTAVPASANPHLEGIPAPASPTAGMTAQEAKEYAAIPDKLPPSPAIPPVTQNQAEARADALIKHYTVSDGSNAPDQNFVPGFVPTLAQKTGDPGLATLERGVQSANPGSLDLRKTSQLNALKEFVPTVTGGPEDIKAGEAALEASTGALRDAAFANKQPIDLQPVEDGINKILAGPDGKRPDVVSTLTPIRDSLHVGGDPTAPFETDPEMAYGIRKAINDKLTLKAQSDSPALQNASRQMIQTKSALDDAIEPGAPGFKNYINAYAQGKQPLDEMEYLQGLNLTDQAGNVNGAAVDRAIKSITKAQSQNGVQKAASVSDDTMDKLQTLQNSLRAMKLSDSAGKPVNSTTFQNLATNSTVGAVAGNPLVHLGMSGAGAALGGGPLGAMAGAGIGMAAHGITSNAESMVKKAILERLLNLQGKGDAAIAQR